MPVPFTKRQRWPCILRVGVWISSMLAWSMILVVSACMVPLPPPDPLISDEKLATIVVGSTTRAETEAALGKPTIIWKAERVWFYEAGPGHGLLVFSYGVAHSDLNQHAVLIRFDSEGRVARLERRMTPVNERNFGDFLRKWLAERPEPAG